MSTDFKVLGSGALKRGESITWHWKHAESARAWSFSVEPDDYGQDPDDIFTPTFPITFEVVRVSYRLMEPGNRRVYVTIKNTSPAADGPLDSLAWPYKIYMSRTGA